MQSFVCSTGYIALPGLVSISQHEIIQQLHLIQSSFSQSSHAGQSGGRFFPDIRSARYTDILTVPELWSSPWFSNWTNTDSTFDLSFLGIYINLRKQMETSNFQIFKKFNEVNSASRLYN